MAQISVDSTYGYVVLIVAAKCILNVWMGVQVGLARRKFNVLYPTMYAIESQNKDAKLFNCVQRGHQNCLEFMPVFFVVLLLGGLQHPIVATVFGALYVVARYFYFIGYSKGEPEKRYEKLGGFHFFALVGLLVCTLSFALHLLLK